MIDENKIKEEEQKILNSLINELDNKLLELDSSLEQYELDRKKETVKSLPEAYGALLQDNHHIKKTKENRKDFVIAKDQLYEFRLKLDVLDEDGQHEKKEIKIGKDTYSDKGNIYIYSWLSPVCRKFVLDNYATEFDGEIEDSYGRKYHSFCKLELSRKIKTSFENVKKAYHMFPANQMDEERILTDAFLDELISRGDDDKFRNIIFSIQKEQSRIMQVPVNRNLVVQGCAGSGKSMIMLHRLPIILYDNADYLDRASIYIISPSETYISMAENLREEIGIENLNMGTIIQYYNFIIKKYGCDINEYCNIDKMLTISRETEQYIYSEKFICDINNNVQNKIMQTDGNININGDTYAGSVRKELVRLNQIYTDSKQIVVSMFKEVMAIINKLRILKQNCVNRKKNIISYAGNTILTNQKIIKEYQKIIKNSDSEHNKTKIKNAQKCIVDALNEIEKMQNWIAKIEFDYDYMKYITKISYMCDEITSKYDEVSELYEKNTMNVLYSVIDSRDDIISECYRIGEIVGNYYEKYPTNIRITDNVFEIIARCKSLEHSVQPMHSFAEIEKISTYISSLEFCNRDIIKNVFEDCMSKMSIVRDDKGIITAPECVAYVLLRILYCYYGIPNKRSESVVTIDEAQCLEPQEIKLICDINDNKVFLNLFGDIRQHIEGTKGINDWTDLQIPQFTYFELKNNYRNIRQITEYCKDKLKIDMDAVSLDGDEVIELTKYDELESKIIDYIPKLNENGLSAIIVKDKSEAQILLENMRGYTNWFNDMTFESQELCSEKWNIITVESTKGLEFTSVIAISQNMKPNEKYIAYTRALRKLTIYDGKMRENRENLDATKEKNKELVEYFQSKGLTVKDYTSEGGKIWILGNKNEIEVYVNEAKKKFKNLSGKFGMLSEFHFKKGWYTNGLK